MASKFKVSAGYEERYGRDPNHALEVDFSDPENDSLVVVGMGFRARNDNVTTMHIEYAPIDESGNIDRSNSIMVKKGTEPEHKLEVWVECEKVNEAIIGFGMRARNDNVTTLHLYARTLDSETGQLSSPETYKGGTEPEHSLEASGQPETEREITLLTGAGARMRDDNITTMACHYGKLSKR